MPEKALFVGGCKATYHQLEPAEPSIRSALEELGLHVTTSGIYHPNGGAEYTGDYSAISASNLENFDLLVLYTTGAEPQGADVDAIIAFVRGGKALVGIHNAADSFTTHAEYVALIGGKFRTHPAQMDITIEFVDTRHPITQGLSGFTVFDELYLFADYHPARVHLLAQTRSYDDNGPVPVCWIREEGAGRVFYLSLGHNPTTLADPHWKELFQRGVQWALRRL
jgi:type 1 glutamine amidotransferase